MARLAQIADWINHVIGICVAWFVVLMVALQFWLVLTRYLFSYNSLFYQEAIVYLHGLMIMLGSAFTLLHGGHVRVDVLFRGASRRRKLLTDLIGSLVFTVPVMMLLVWAAWPDVHLSWTLGEGSTETSGIAYKHILKTSVIVFALLMALQALSIALKSALELRGHALAKGPQNPEMPAG